MVHLKQPIVHLIKLYYNKIHLNQQDSFKYYIDLAHAYLAFEINSPLYSYYYALINYYNKNYLEVLAALNNPTSKEYPEAQKHLSAKINALYSATLFVAIPIDFFKVLITLSEPFLITTPQPAGPGFPLEEPSKNTVTELLFIFRIVDQASAILADSKFATGSQF